MLELVELLLVVLAEAPTAASSIELLLAVRSFEAHPAMNINPPNKIANFRINLLLVSARIGMTNESRHSPLSALMKSVLALVLLNE